MPAWNKDTSDNGNGNFFSLCFPPVLVCMGPTLRAGGGHDGDVASGVLGEARGAAGGSEDRNGGG